MHSTRSLLSGTGELIKKYKLPIVGMPTITAKKKKKEKKNSLIGSFEWVS